MKRIRYTKFTGDLSSSFGLEDLMQALSDFLLDSGFNDPYSQFQEFNDQTLENLREAIKQALESGEMFDEESQEQLDQPRRRSGGRAGRPDHPEDAGAELHQRRDARPGPGRAG